MIEPTSLGVRALALRVIACQVADVEAWLHWEDYPNLSEAAFEELVAEVAKRAVELSSQSSAYDNLFEVDSAYIFDGATA